LGEPFQRAVTFVIDRLEGGATPVHDTGGNTRFGVSEKAFPHIDIAKLTRQGAEQIYLDHYWNVVNASSLPPSVGLLVFDAAVNLGAVRAAQMLQRLLGLKDDGVIGPKTIHAVKTYQPLSELRVLYSESRLRYYEELSSWKPLYRPFARGWRLRVLRVADEAGGWARSETGVFKDEVERA